MKVDCFGCEIRIKKHHGAWFLQAYTIDGFDGCLG